MTTNYRQFTNTGASIILTWSASRGADNYTVNVTPATMPGQIYIADFTITGTSLQLVLEYNVNYAIKITAQNGVGSNSAVFPQTICEQSVN